MRSPERILVISLRQIGDMLVTTPLIEDVRLAWPQAQIDVLGFEACRGLFWGNPAVKVFIAAPGRPTLSEAFRFLRRLWRQYDLALVTQPTDRSYLLGLVASSRRWSIVPHDRKQDWWKRRLSERVVDIDYFHQHVVTEKRRLLPTLSARPISLWPPSAKPAPQALINWLGREDYVVIHATPLGAYKRVPSALWVAILTALLKTHRVVLTGSSHASDKALNAVIKGSLPQDQQNLVWDASGTADFPEIAGLLEKARLYVGVDTSISHLAAAVGVPMVVFFGPTPPTNFGPWPKGYAGEQPYQLRQRIQRVGSITLLQGPGACVPCRKAGCDDSTTGPSDCLQNLTFDFVWPEIVARLAH